MTAPEAAGDVRAVAQPVTRAAHPRRDLPGRDGKPGPDHRETVRSLCGDLPALVPRGGLSRPRGRASSCVMAIGSDAGTGCSAPRPAELHPFREIRAGGAPRRLDARRPAVPHPRRAHGPLLRAGDADHGAARRRGLAGRRGARLPLLRRPRPARASSTAPRTRTARR